jgi:large subunit ribosomal protein L29
MASSKTQPLFDMSTPELEQQLATVQQQLLNFRFQYATHQNTNYEQLRTLKREVARIKTILHERELTESEE